LGKEMLGEVKQKMETTETIRLDGTHLMLDVFGCDKEALANPELITKFLSELPDVLEMHRLMDPKVLPYEGGDGWDKGGVTGFVVIAESHISIHTFAHDGFFSADVYSCKPFDVEAALELFRKYFKGSEEKIKIANRDIEIIRNRNNGMLTSTATAGKKLAPVRA
jgi:S-adenosylmethionine decarboxylase